MVRRGKADRIELDEAKKRLCKELGIAPSVEEFVATAQQAITDAGLNIDQCIRCIRLGAGIDCNAAELKERNASSYIGFIYQQTLEGLITVLRTAGTLTPEEKERITKNYETRATRRNPSVWQKTIQEYFADAIIEKCLAQRGMPTQPVETTTRGNP
jgi:hypothetical protein